MANRKSSKLNFIFQLIFFALIDLNINVSNCQEFPEIVVDNYADLMEVGTSSKYCTYLDRLIDFCKIATPTTNEGFWISCSDHPCVVSIIVGKLGNYNKVPKLLQIFSYVKGKYARIQVKYRITPDSGYWDLNPYLENLDDWTLSPVYNLSGIIPSLNPFSEISLELTSKEDDKKNAAILDKVTFTFSDGNITRTTESEPGTTTAEPTTREPTTREQTTAEPTTAEPTTREPTTAEPTTTEFQIESTTEGACGMVCSSADRYGRNWTGCAGKTVVQECPNDSEGNAKWYCNENGQFEGIAPDFTNCNSNWIPEFKNVIEKGEPITPEEAEKLLDKISDNIKSGSYFGHEIVGILNVTGGILSLVETNVSIDKFEELTDNGWTICGDLLIKTEPWSEIDVKSRAETGSEFLSVVEKTSLGLSGRVILNRTIRNFNSIYRKDFQKFEEFRFMSGVQKKSEDPLTFPDNYSSDDSHIDLPNDWADYLKSENVTFSGIELKSDYANSIFPGYLNMIGPEQNSSYLKFLNGNILGFSFGADLEEKLQKLLSDRITDVNMNVTDPKPQRLNFTNDGVKITFQHDIPAWGDNVENVRRMLHNGEVPKAVSGTSACVYWDSKNLIWSSEGCEILESERSETICECKHLTAFALLMDVHNYIGKDTVLEILTLILCPISIICLAICVYIFATIKSERSPRNELTLNLCVCLLIGNLLMIVLMDKNYLYLSDEVCIASAVAIHYVFLCAMLWMALEGALIFKVLFLDVFGQGKDYLILQHCLAYGIPLIIVGATGLITGLRGDHGYANDSFCWLNGSYIWAFLGPTAIILTVNLVILILSVRKAFVVRNRPEPSLGAQKNETKSLTWLKGCISLSVLLGLTWIFGYLMVIDHSILANIAAYIFTILNASQGIFLFVFHVLMNANVKSTVKRRLPNCFLSESSSSRPQPTVDTSTTNTAPSLGERVRQSFSSLKNIVLRRPSENHND